MANVMTPVDVYAIINAAAKEMYGGDTTLQARDTSTFVTVGEAMLRTGYENTLNALSLVFARSFISIRPYTGKFSLFYKTRQEFGAITRKISYFYDGMEQSQDWNTDIAQSQLEDGQSIDHYKIRKRYPLEVNFAGLKTVQKHYTRFRKQLKRAFQSERDFAEFWYGLGVEVANELAMFMETENRLMTLNAIGAIYNTGKATMKVNLTKTFNDKFGTSYTSAQLRTTYLKEFLAHMVATIKYTSDMMTENNDLFHLTPAKNNDAGEALTLLRHTPKTEQRLLMLSPLWIDAEALVLPEIFNDRYLKLDQYESVNYWQNPNNVGGVKVKPNQFNVTNGQSVTGTEVNIPYVVGLMFDNYALATSIYADDVITTPHNAAGDYYNIYYHWARDYQNDFTENMVLLYMEDTEA